jgi:2-dehydro-3-deoxyphosphogluconate aldolase/(4S)-4-hydroxy-2-oxoglutarate aldolase
MVDLAHDLGVLAVPGAATANELWNAHLSGAMLVKLYPAVTSWSPEMLAGLPDPMRQVNTLPTGGITADDVEQWLDAGAFACGLGTSLTIEAADLLSSRILGRRGVLR